MGDDLHGLVIGKIFKEPGTYFFNVMYYSVGAGLSEIVAMSINRLIYLLNWIFTKIISWISSCFGNMLGDWFGGWMSSIYDFLFSSIKSGKLDALKEVTVMKKAEEFKKIQQLATAASEADKTLLVGECLDAGLAVESAAAAIIIPALLAVGSYEALQATSKAVTSDPNSPNNPRIALGLILDTGIRYIWPAIQLILP